jgi:hypothetical protein
LCTSLTLLCFHTWCSLLRLSSRLFFIPLIISQSATTRLCHPHPPLPRRVKHIPIDILLTFLIPTYLKAPSPLQDTLYPPSTSPRGEHTALLTGSAGVGVLHIGAGVFIHDAFTYSEKHLDRVPVSPPRVEPEIGGAKRFRS